MVPLKQLGRELSVPERIGGFGVLAAVAATAWPAVTSRTGLGLPCPLRTLTGIPCPACGLTTAAIALVHGDLHTACAANPAILLLAVPALAVGPLIALRATALIRPPQPWPVARRRLTGWFALLLAFASWLYQLHRLDIS
ncbi:DUF2752 domain-containing protein [Actinoplanes sp. NPDC049596]|uniref:DUF2752 domain-containing protein n=1 Tax=unclassified Actinoplanes TaxID=2626549 RepID=UPI00343F8FC4